MNSGLAGAGQQWKDCCAETRLSGLPAVATGPDCPRMRDDLEGSNADPARAAKRPQGLSWRPPPGTKLWPTLGLAVPSVPAVGTPRATSPPVSEQAPRRAQKRLAGPPVCAELHGSRGLRVPGRSPASHRTLCTWGSLEPPFLRAFICFLQNLTSPTSRQELSHRSGLTPALLQTGPADSGDCLRVQTPQDFSGPMTCQSLSPPIFTQDLT